jgi:Fe-S cluster assembly protein SufD
MHTRVTMTTAPPTTTRAGTEGFVGAFEAFERQCASRGPSWLTPVRKAAIACFAQLGFPTMQHEDWRFTNVAPLTKRAFVLAGRPKQRVSVTDLGGFMLDASTGPCLVFVNGRFMPALSRAGSLPAGCVLGSLAELVETEATALQAELARYADYQDQPFTALNTAFLRDGAYVRIPDHTAMRDPIQVLQVAVTEGAPTVAHPRLLVVVGRSSQATIIESHIGFGNDVYFTNAVTELLAGENATVDHYKVELESVGAAHIGTLQFHQQRDSNLTAHCISLGGGLVRHDINATLAGEGCNCTLNGLFMLAGEQHVDSHLRVEHAQPHGTSRENFWGILDGQAHGVFTGRIVVHHGAQKTDAKQTNKNLLLSEAAQIDTKPQLEIFANDVKCTHGATIGQIDHDAMFYLRARGISEPAARSLLTYAFARTSLAQIKVEPLRRQLHRAIVARLPHGELFEELT